MDRAKQALPSELEFVESCDLCGGNEFEFVLASNGWNLERCKECELVFTSPRYTESHLSEMYKTRYYERDHAYLSSQLVEPSEDEYRLAKSLLEKCVNRKPGGKPRFLEVGCGAGRIEAAFQKVGWDATGIDMSSKAVKAGCDRGLDLRVAHLGDAALGTFELIAAFHVLEHVHSPKAFLLDCVHRLTSNGLLLIEVPNYDSRQSRKMHEDWPYLYPDSHLFQFTISTLSRYLVDSGFKTIEYRRVGGRGPLEDSTRTNVGVPTPSFSKKAGSSLKDIVFKLRRVVYWSPSARQFVRYLLWHKFRYGEFIRVVAERT